ncbi:MAG TPA: dipeptide epimerase [Rhizomicrobium sp.]|jgi:L-alanine-DL-glutamate epimerase-like enolase superfamily enzyme|nr:dipeptide epimerase [Rhizomicrobium sp.]
MPSLAIAIEEWPLKAPFRIAGYEFTQCDLIVVSLEERGITGRGEAAGVYYHDETPDSMRAQIEEVRSEIEAGIDRMALRELLPPGGARNALDCALWDLEARRSGIPAWKRAGLDAAPAPLLTTYTIGADSPESMAATARRYAPAPRIKMKLTGEDDAARVRAVRTARPDAWIAVDANQAFTRTSLEALIPTLRECDVQLIEQPVKIGAEAELEDFCSPIPLAADESLQGLSAVAGLRGRFDVANVKLDKCGGVTEALLMVEAIRAAGMRPMVGCMDGTSLAMMPGCLVGQLCDFVDMDGAMFLKNDRAPAVHYENGWVRSPNMGWGKPDSP